MQIIRLHRVGRKHVYIYRIVATNKTNTTSTSKVQILGQYKPQYNKENDKNYLQINTNAIDLLLLHGAQMSERVTKLYKIAKSNNIYMKKS